MSMNRREFIKNNAIAAAAIEVTFEDVSCPVNSPARQPSCLGLIMPPCELINCMTIIGKDAGGDSCDQGDSQHSHDDGRTCLCSSAAWVNGGRIHG